MVGVPCVGRCGSSVCGARQNAPRSSGCRWSGPHSQTGAAAPGWQKKGGLHRQKEAGRLHKGPDGHSSPNPTVAAACRAGQSADRGPARAYAPGGVQLPPISESQPPAAAARTGPRRLQRRAPCRCRLRAPAPARHSGGPPAQRGGNPRRAGRGRAAGRVGRGGVVCGSLAQPAAAVRGWAVPMGLAPPSPVGLAHTHTHTNSANPPGANLQHGVAVRGGGQQPQQRAELQGGVAPRRPPAHRGGV